MIDAKQRVRVMADRRNHASREQLLCRVRAEFVEMPCLRLTSAQARRLFGMRDDICDRVLATLIAERAICQDDDGRYRAYDEEQHGFRVSMMSLHSI
jgi:hypothetical protein